MLVKVISREHRYGGRQYLRGETFDAPDRDAKTLKLLRKVVEVAPGAPIGEIVGVRAAVGEHESAPEPAVVETEATVAEPAAAAEPEAVPAAPKPHKGKYARRDLRAEDEA